MVTVSGSVRGQHVPAPLTRFFGRAAETAAVTALLRESRLVTLVGAPGAGKTRLAAELGGTLASEPGERACFVDLAAVTEGEAVPAAVASALGVAQEAGSAVVDTVIGNLGTAGRLIILDNCEHLVDAAAGLAHRVLAGCPGVRVLATSRIGLGVAGEQRFPVPSLDAESAVALFTDRARLVRPGFAPGGADRRDVERICRRLDGLPLAIELAAAWHRVLSPAQILHRLDTVLPMLTGTDSGASGRRHRTMEATVAWSYRLLTPAQQALFDRLSVFAGGFDLAAAESVAGDEGSPLDDLTALVDHSLVLAEPADPAMRYRLLEPVREYGAAALARRDAEPERVRARHAAHYLEVARRCDIGLRRGDRSSHMREMCREEGNLLAALGWARTADPGTALRLATALAFFLGQHGSVNDARTWLAELVDGGVGDARSRSVAAGRLGGLALRQRDDAEARRRYIQYLALAREAGDSSQIARALRNLAVMETADGHIEAATGLAQESLRLYEELGDDKGRGWTWTVLAHINLVDGQWQAGERCCRQAFAANGEPRSTELDTMAHHGIAYVAANTGDTATHRRHLAALLTDLRDVAGLVDDPTWMWNAGVLAANEGRTRAALKLAGAARAVGRRGNHMIEAAMAICEAAVERGRREVGARTADRLMARGAAMTAAELMDEALAYPTAADRPLSAREREVADLVADGLTNEQIAARLVLSRRTVETHVENLRRKLDLGGRNEVIAWALGRRMEAERVR